MKRLDLRRLFFFHFSFVWQRGEVNRDEEVGVEKIDSFSNVCFGTPRFCLK